MGWLRNIGFIRTAEFGLSFGCFLGGLAFGTDPVLMWIVLILGWALAAAGILTAQNLLGRTKAVLCSLILIVFVAEGLLLYGHSNHVSVYGIFAGPIGWVLSFEWARLILAGIAGILVLLLAQKIQRTRFGREQVRIVRPMEKGFLDYRTDVEECATAYSKVLVATATQANRLSKVMNVETAKITRLTAATLAGGSQSEALRKARAIAAKMAKHMDAYCQRTHADEKKFSELAATLITAIEWLSINQTDYRNPQTLAQLDGLRIACETAQQGGTGFSAAIAGLKGIEATMTSSCERTIEQNNRLIVTLGNMVALCERVIAGPSLSVAVPSLLSPAGTGAGAPP
jgi:hypothetical protein